MIQTLHHLAHSKRAGATLFNTTRESGRTDASRATLFNTPRVTLFNTPRVTLFNTPRVTLEPPSY